MKSCLSKNNNIFCSISFIFVMIISCMLAVQAMEEAPVNNHATEKCIILLREGMRHFRHPSICAIAGVNSDWQKAVLATVKNRKDYLINLHPELKKFDNVAWNGYGTAYARASHGSKLNWSLYMGLRAPSSCSKIKELMIERRFIGESDMVPDYHVWQLCYGELPHKPSVIFNGIQDVCIHAYGKVGDDVNGHVVEYRLLSNGQRDAVKCVTKIGKKFIALQMFLEFSSLLQAFLKSTTVMRAADTLYKIFTIEGIVVPHDYKDCQQYLRTQRTYLSFETLPKKVQKTIVALHNAQNQIVSEKKRKSACFG